MADRSPQSPQKGFPTLPTPAVRPMLSGGGVQEGNSQHTETSSMRTLETCEASLHVMSSRLPL